VVIFQENVSFDHYFGTYPYATNPSGEPQFHPSRETPTVNGLHTQGLLANNPNSANPERLDRSEALTCDQGHGYTAEQKAYDMGLMDKFVQNTNNESCAPPDKSRPNLVMDYYDGNDRRPGSELRHLLSHAGRPHHGRGYDTDGRPEYRRRAEPVQDHVGMVPGRLLESKLRAGPPKQL
jgi:hypothetical protein